MDVEKKYNEGDRSIRTIVDYAISLKNQGKTGEAINVLNEGIDRYPESSLIFTLLGKIYVENGEYDKAINYLKKAYDLDKFNYQAVENLAVCAEKLGLRRNAEYYSKIAYYLFPEGRKLAESLPGLEELQQIVNEEKDLIE